MIPVKEKCKNAAKLLDELDGNKIKLPFVLCPSKKPVPAMSSDPKLAWKSPLVMSDTNGLFLSQAKVHNCREAVRANPLRNIAGKLFQFSRNLGLDLVKVSQQVQRNVDIKREQELRRAEVAEISSAIVNATLKKSQRSTQTDFNPCRRCEELDLKKFATKSTQVTKPGKETSTQYEPEIDSFSVSFNARTIHSMTPKQHNALVKFCSAFGIEDPRFAQTNDLPMEYQNDDVTERDDRLTFANPENPNAIETLPDFISFSPPRHESPQRSPRRKSIADRLGRKIQSPLPLRQFDDDDSGSSRYFEYRIPSPRARNARRPESSFSPFNNRARSRSCSPTRPMHQRHGRY